MNKVSVKKVFSGRVLRLERHELTIGKGQVIRRDIVVHGGSVAILPLLDARHVVLVKQYRHAVGKTLVEIPAGTLAPREKPLFCAHRELEEETGYRARSMKKIWTFYSAPGFCTEKLTLYCARGLYPGVFAPEEDEQVTPLTVSFKQAFRWLRQGKIHDSKTQIALLWLQLHH